MKTPTIHLNGTSAEALEKQYKEVYQAVDAALNMHAQAAPHARDYYVQEDGAYEVARVEHAGRTLKLKTVRSELLEIIESIQKQKDARRK